MVQTLWQDALNPQLAQRLLRPLICPGVIPDTLAVAIFERSRQLKQRLSLLHQFQQRWNQQLDLQVPEQPIVYAYWVAPAAQSIVSENPSDRNQEGSSESVRIEHEHTTSTQTVIQQPVNGSTDSTSPSLPLVVQAKYVNPAASTATSHLLPTPSNSTPLQSSIIEDRESALPRVSAGAASTPPHPQLSIVAASPQSPLIESELNRGRSSVEEQALVVQAKNQPALPTSSQLPEQKPLMSAVEEQAQRLAPAAQSVVSENPSDRNQEGSSESVRIREHTTSTQTVIQQPVNGSTDSTSPSLPLVVQAKYVNPAASTATSHLLPTPSNSTPLQSSIIEDRETEDRESALPRVSAGAASTPPHPQLSIVAASPRSPLMESELNRGIAAVAEQALVVQAKNQPALPASSQLPEQKPLMRSPATNQLTLSSATSPPTGSGLNTAIAASKSLSQPLEELPLIKAETTAALPSSQTPRQPGQPLVFARPASIYTPSSKQESPMTTASKHQSTERSPIVNAQPADQRRSTSTVSPTQPPAVDVSYLTQQVERKLMRKLTVERERRGQRTWH
ncbi:hypothetical protein JOY44_21560 [Phormidium sp. CLA17]|uniref:hypothetical protein n=1 Tax=Leptolyngbya sp. Cla-17 TaxID=2803751 RepID=UPI00149263D8|nr:hypothetical protein [Leptolyngbya sp. Cla-17]MBM0744170.1 hypothetical protein [Leptolyngbya sp. Cla-17]